MRHDPTRAQRRRVSWQYCSHRLWRQQAQGAVLVVCPFCSRVTRARVSNLKGRGKKCRRCGALHLWGWTRGVFQIAP